MLVSKRWLRVGTPLLYSAVILWEPRHTKAVAALVKTHPALGKAIRMLRVEGGMGKDLYTIARNAPNVHALYLSVQMRSSEGISGLRRAMPMLNPTTLYLYSTTTRVTNKSVV